MTRLNKESQELIDSSYKMRNILKQVLPNDIIDYVLELVAKDMAHQKLKEITKDN